MMPSSLKEITTNFQKLEKFEWVGYHRWQKKVHFLTILNVVYVLSTPLATIIGRRETRNPDVRKKWENDDYI